MQHQHNGPGTNIVVGGMSFEEEEVIEENIIIEESSNDEHRFGSRASREDRIRGEAMQEVVFYHDGEELRRQSHPEVPTSSLHLRAGSSPFRS